MVRLANEEKILALGLDSKIDPKFRLQVAENESFSRQIEEEVYYAAFSGASFDVKI